VADCRTFHTPSLALALGLAAGGCQTTPKPLALPATALAATYQPGEADPGSARPASMRSVALYAVSAAPEGTPVALAAAAIVRERGAPFRGKSRLPIGSRWLTPADVDLWLSQRDTRGPAQQQQLGETSAVVHPSLITTVGPKNRTQSTEQMELPDLRIRWSVHQRAFLTQLITGDFGEAEHEVVLISAPLSAQDSVGFFIPNDRAEAGGLLLLLQPSGDAGEDQLAQAQEMATSEVAANESRDELPRSWQVARDAIGERNRRPALLALASPLGIPRVTDLLLAADEAALIRISQQLDRLDPNAEGLSWLVESATWQALIPRAERDELSPALLAAFTRHLGGLGSDGATLRLLVSTATNEEQFATRLIDENLAALTDRSAAVRASALTWLEDRQIEVQGYDPSGDKLARRDAVRRLLKQREAGR